VLSTADKLVVNEKNFEYQLPFNLSQDEIRECFSTLDIHKHNYITTEEVTFFLDILGETATEQEIVEMVRMLDIQGTGKVYFDEFMKMSTGKSLSPIGIAYPPSIRLLNKKNLNKMNRKGLIDDIGDVNRDKAEVSFIYDRVQKPDDSVITKQLKALEKLGGADKKTKESKTHNEIIHDFINRNNIVTIQVIENIKTKKLREIKAAKYELFITMLGLHDSEQSRAIFNRLLAPNSTTIDIRQVFYYSVNQVVYSELHSVYAFLEY
jgi:hypothetical protein